MLISGINVPPDQRFKSVFEIMSDDGDIRPDGEDLKQTLQSIINEQGIRQTYLPKNSGEVTLLYTDTDNSLAAFEAYEIILIVRQLKKTRS